MANRLTQYRIAEAALQDTFLPWIKDHATDVLSGRSPLIVVDQAQQIPYLKSRTLAAGITALGVEWLTVAGLRRYLCHRLNLVFEPLGRENLEFLIRVHASTQQSALAKSLASAPADALLAMDELGRSGRMPGEWRRILPDDFVAAGNVLEQTGDWLPSIEEECLHSAGESSERIGSVLLYGWTAKHFPDLRLITVLKNMGDDLSVLVPQPRFLGGEDVEELWILELEKVLQVDSEVSQDPAAWQSQHEAYVNSLVIEGEPEQLDVPEVRVGHTDYDQARIVSEWIQQQEALIRGEYPLGCLVSGEGGTLYQLSREFSRLGIVFHQEVGEVLSSGGFHTFQKLLVRCFASDSDVEEVLRLLEWLLAREEACVSGLEYSELRRRCIQMFNRRPKRGFSELFEQQDSECNSNRHTTALARFAAWLKPWPEKIHWDEAHQRWLDVTRQFGFSADYLEPVWSRLSRHLSGTMIPSRFFFEYLEALLGAPGLWRDEAAINPYARVVITTPEAAAGRSWGSLVFLDSQEGVWPRSINENPFLTDALRTELNRECGAAHSRLLTVKDQLQIQRQLVLSLMENCTGSILFSGSLTDGQSPEVKTFPNEWAAQVLLAGREDASSVMQLWEQGLRCDDSAETPFAPQLEWDRKSFTVIHQNRENPELAPGGHEFSFSEADANTSRPYPASQLDQILAAPASFALKHLLDAVPRSTEDFVRNEALLLGIWVHTTLADVLNAHRNRPLKNFLPQHLSVDVEQSGLWAEVLTQKAAWMVRACLQELESLGDAWTVERVEWKPDVACIETLAGTVELSGQLDLILNSDMGQQLIIDFKTGRTGEIPTPQSLQKKASGMQYVAYLLLTEQGSSDRAVRVINPFHSLPRELRVEHLGDAAPHLESLALMASQRTYPRRGALRDEYGFSAEVLPLTTLALDPEILEAKWQKFLVEGGAV